MCRQLMATYAYLDPDISIQIDHLATVAVVHKFCLTVSVGVALGMVTRYVIEVTVVREIEQEIVTA